MTQQLQDEITADYARYEFHLVAQKLQSFCSETLGSFYLDILKDRLYTAGENSKARRSAQNALHHITQTLVRLMAPVLSFTGEEVWAVLSGNSETSVFEQQWLALPAHQLDADTLNAWQEIRALREQVNKKIEEQRATGTIGSALQAEVEIRAPQPLFEILNRLGDDLRLVLITSQASVQLADEIEIIVTPSAHAKCDRCWHYRADVGSDAAHPTLCGRCVSNLFGDGEARQFA
jgi:isoleucyl-tRNA synthetase